MPILNTTKDDTLDIDLFTKFENIPINEFDQFQNNMRFNFSGKMDNDTKYNKQRYFNNSMMLKIGRLFDDMEI